MNNIGIEKALLDDLEKKTKLYKHFRLCYSRINSILEDVNLEHLHDNAITEEETDLIYIIEDIKNIIDDFII